MTMTDDDRQSAHDDQPEQLSRTEPVAEAYRLGYDAGKRDGWTEGHKAGEQDAGYTQASRQSNEQDVAPLARAQTCPSWCQGHTPSHLEQSRVTDHWRDVARVPASADDPAPPDPGWVDSYVFRLGSVGVACAQEYEDTPPTVYLHAAQPLHNYTDGEGSERDVSLDLSAKDADDLAAALTRAARLIRLPRGATQGGARAAEQPVPTQPAEVTR